MAPCINLQLEQLPENLMKNETFADIRKNTKVLSKLRHPGDPPPVRIAPPAPHPGAVPHSCALSVQRYIEANPECVAIKGFKLWGIGNKRFWMTACFHCVARTPHGEYIDVTPPEIGDEGQPMVFLPSSRVYPEFSVEVLAHMTVSGLEPRTGLVAYPVEWYRLKKHGDADLDPNLLSQDADGLTLWLAPFTSKIPRDMNMKALAKHGARVFEGAPGRFVIPARGFVRACEDWASVVDDRRA